MIINVAQLCELLQGELIGNGDTEIHGPSQIDKGIPGTVTFLSNPKYEEFAYTTVASALIVPSDFVPKNPIKASLIKVDDVYVAMMLLVDKFGDHGMPESGVSKMAQLPEGFDVADNISIGAFSIIEKGVTIGKGSVVYPQVYIGNGAQIGEDVILYPGAKIYADTIIGDRCIIHSNTVIGCDGFGYRPDKNGHYIKIKHAGKVIIEQDVEIGANTVIDRGTLTFTKIGEGSKIDNLVQIAHNVVVGKHTVIAALTGIAGSSSIGDHVRIGGQVGIKGHIHIADRIEIQAQSGVHTGKYPAGARLYGSPAINFNDYLKSYAVFKQLPDYKKKIDALEKQIIALKGDSK